MEEKNYLLTLGGSGEPYTLLAEMEPLKAHISAVDPEGKGTNYDTKEEEPRVIVSYKIDEEGEGQGQVYNAYYKPSNNEKSSLYPAVMNAVGEYVYVDGKWDSSTLIGKTVRVMLETYEGKTGPRQKVKQVLKPAKGQKIVESFTDAESVEDYDALLDSLDK